MLSREELLARSMNNRLTDLHVLISRPEHDFGTRYLSHWSKDIIEFAKKKSAHVLDLHKDKANKREFEGRMKKLSPRLVLLNGHGSARAVTGHNNEALVELGSNELLLKKKITYAVACDSAKELGRAVVDDETTFIGYEEKFVINMNRRYINNPLQDERAARFLNSSNEVAVSLLKGHTAIEASERSKNAFRKEIRHLLSSSITDSDALEDAKNLYWNMTHQICLGSQSSKL